MSQERHIAAVVGLVALSAGAGLRCDASAYQNPAIVTALSACSDARFVAGAALTGDERPGPVNPGEVKTIQQIVSSTLRHTVGYLYTTINGQQFVSDRPRKFTKTGDLEAMNAVLRKMGRGTTGETFDPAGDDGFTYYAVNWSTIAARRLHLSLIGCGRSVHDR